MRSFVTAKNYAETVVVAAMVALNGPDCSNRYPFFGNAGFRTRLTFSLSLFFDYVVDSCLVKVV